MLVRITAAALNPLDVKPQPWSGARLLPLTFPPPMGTDLAGTIEKTGSLTSRWRASERVMERRDRTSGGAFAEYAIVPEDHLVLVPQVLNFNSAAGLPTAAGTAWQALVETAGLQARQTVLVHAVAPPDQAMATAPTRLKERSCSTLRTRGGFRI